MPILLRRWKCELSPAAFVLCDLRGTIHVSGGNVHPTWPPYRCTRLGSLFYLSAPGRCFGSLGMYLRALEAVPSIVMCTLDQKI